MTVGHPRQQLADLIRPELPPKWRVIENERSFDTTTVRTVIIKQRTVVRLPQAPIATRQFGFVLSLVSPYRQDMTRAEDDLDASLPILLEVLDRARGLSWSTADKVMVPSSSENEYLGYDITATVNIKKENS